jgi:hypothetical protein
MIRPRYTSVTADMVVKGGAVTEAYATVVARSSVI